jgi:hypothetical protein
MALRASNQEHNSFTKRRSSIIRRSSESRSSQILSRKYSFGSGALDAEEVTAVRKSSRLSSADSPRIGYGGGRQSVNSPDTTQEASRQGLRSRLNLRLSRRKSEDIDFFELPQVKARRLYMIVPGGPRKAMWDSLVSFFALYIVFSVPFELSFATSPEAIEMLVDAFFLVDLCVSFRVAPIDLDGSPVIEPRAAALEYLSSWFFVDFLALFPFDRIVESSLSSTNFSAACCTSLPAKLCTLLKLLRLNVMRRHSHLFDQLMGARALHIARLIIILSAVAHWIACFWWLIGSSNQPPVVNRNASIVLSSDELLLPGAQAISWVRRMDLQDEEVLVQYLASFYWALTVVVKSPWLHPAPPIEFVFACATVSAPQSVPFISAQSIICKRSHLLLVSRFAACLPICHKRRSSLLQCCTLASSAASQL